MYVVLVNIQSRRRATGAPGESQGEAHVGQRAGLPAGGHESSPNTAKYAPSPMATPLTLRVSSAKATWNTPKRTTTRMRADRRMAGSAANVLAPRRLNADIFYQMSKTIMLDLTRFHEINGVAASGRYFADHGNTAAKHRRSKGRFDLAA